MKHIDGLGHSNELTMVSPNMVPKQLEMDGIVQQNGGHVWIDSVEGKGTTFTLYLPVALANTTMAADSGPAEPVLSPGTQTVLIVEDEGMPVT